MASNPSPISGVPPPTHSQFKPGQSGNPGGKPRKGFITDEVARLLEEQHPKRPGRTRKQVLAEQWVKRAGRDQKALDSMLDRLEGKPTETQEIDLKTGVNLNPVVVIPGNGRDRPKSTDPNPAAGSPT